MNKLTPKEVIGIMRETNVFGGDILIDDLNKPNEAESYKENLQEVLRILKEIRKKSSVIEVTYEPRTDS